MGLQFSIAIRSTHKYAVKASGDAARIVDLPDGGVGLVVVDGQGSGLSARLVALQVSARIVGLLADGARAKAAAEAASDALFAARSGQVSVSFDIVQVTRTGAIEIARCSTNALLLFDGAGWRQVEQASEPGGRFDRQEPQVCLLDASDVRAVVIATDGVDGAGRKHGQNRSLLAAAQALSGQPATDFAAALADRLFSDSMRLDHGRPGDDMTIGVMLLGQAESDQRIERHDFSRVVR